MAVTPAVPAAAGYSATPLAKQPGVGARRDDAGGLKLVVRRELRA